MWRFRSIATLLTIPLLAGVSSAGEGPAPQKPIDLGAEEDVEVRLVTVDTVVLDAKDRTVPGLHAEDFEMTVDRKPVAVETFDEDCPIGAAEDPRGLSPSAARQLTPLTDRSRRAVLAIDYYHVGPASRAEVFQNVRDLVNRRLAGDEELMLVALANGLRVEQPFTRDREAFLRALRRMEYDVSLWSANYGHLTENAIFDGLEALYEILGAIEGPKALVLFSDGLWPSEELDGDFRRMAVAAGNSRTVLFPVVSSGLLPRVPT